jgi:hypothetical protein
MNLVIFYVMETFEAIGMSESCSWSPLQILLHSLGWLDVKRIHYLMVFALSRPEKNPLDLIVPDIPDGFRLIYVRGRALL